MLLYYSNTSAVHESDIKAGFAWGQIKVALEMDETLIVLWRYKTYELLQTAILHNLDTNVQSIHQLDFLHASLKLYKHTIQT